MLAEELVASKVAAVVTGGATRAESVRAALAEIPDEALVVIVHDAARPLVDDAVIERVCSPLARGLRRRRAGAPARRHGQAGRARPRRRDGRPLAISSRCRRPQAFTATALRAAYAGDGPVAATDCASLVEARGGRVRVVDGDVRLAQDHDRGRSRARRIVALRAVFFDVGETLVDEERWWRVLAERDGPAAARRVGGARRDDRARRGAQRALGPPRDRAAVRLVGRARRTSSTTSTRTRSHASRPCARSGLRVGIVGNQTAALEQWARDAGASGRRHLVVGEPRRAQAGSARSSSGSSSSPAVRRARSPTSATGSTTTCSRRAAAGLVAVHVRRGPWGRLQRTPPEAAIGLDDLASLPDALASLR